MNNPNETDLITQGQPVDVQKTLDALPGLVGAIDRAIFDQSGKKQPFVLLIFASGGAMHATNIHPPADAVKAIKDLAAHWDHTEPNEHAGA
jgi:hypothetical protein